MAVVWILCLAPSSVKALREAVASGRIRHRAVKDELRENLIARLRAGGPLFPGIVGYDDTVVPQVVNAILSKHNFILLGLRGQAKTRLLRALTSLARRRDPGGAGLRDSRRPAGAALRRVPRPRRDRRRRLRDRLAAARGAATSKSSRRPT